MDSQVTITGVLSDKTGESLPGATVKVLKPDSSFIQGVSSDNEGKFSLSLSTNSKFILVFSYLSYRDKYRVIETKNQALDLGKILLREDAKTLNEVEIKTLQQRGEQKGDTTAFNADAFKTNPEATAEDLLKKLPGVTSDNSGVKVNGESVQKVLVDGKPFFGDDPNAALKNLPAEIVDKVEVFDKMSDQAQFSGFDDGNQQKTINIVTKKGKNIGQFGKVYGGYGSDETGTPRYNGGAALNSFNATRRISLLLLSNNINQQNFTMSDITGALGNSGQSGGGRGRNSAANNLLTSPQNGNSATQSAGLNYSDAWGKKINVSGSYFFNYTDNRSESNTTRSYFTDDNIIYKEETSNKNINQNHRVNFRFEYNIDSSNKLTILPTLNFQNNNATSSLLGNTSHLDGVKLNNALTNSKSLNLGYDFSNTLLYLHKFKKNGRTFSLNFDTKLSERDNTGSYYSLYSDTAETLRDQEYKTYSYNKKISPKLSYTEPLNKNAQIEINYNPSYTKGKSDKSTNDYNIDEYTYSDFNTTLSNKYINIYETQRGGLSYKYRKDKLSLSFGVDAQQSTLSGEQTFPYELGIDQSFKNILPNARLNYKFSKTKNLRVYYRSSTDIPELSQLQNVIDISNPLQVKSGNDQLKQSFDNRLGMRFGGFNPTTSRNTMLFMNINYSNNYISNASYILRSDSIIQGYNVAAGSQLTKPINVDGFYNIRMFGVYGFPLKSLKSNVNVNGGVNYNHTPTIINDFRNYSNSYATNAGVFLGSNISEKLDFSIGYNGNYTVVKNTTQINSDNSYFTHTATFKLNYILKNFVFNTDISNTIYKGLSQSFNQAYYLWNAYIGYKFLKNKSLEAKISVFDILNQNRSISRTVTGSYTEDNYTSVLRRYAMFTLTYTLKNFKSGTAPKTDDENNPFPGGPSPGSHTRPPDH
ncbi:TonB-dependent receptor [Aurantibacillus circumpalustris]|uniref:TonB-dependent receptor n=1 Tax=Aurantibacillus circumpalustris TaxID=3036359 RepID=UPI00295B03B0|nr:TonB-dependent receptor [Aurantibacillus circumpalustris]